MEKIEEMLKQLTSVKSKPETSSVKVLESSFLINPSHTESITSNEPNSSNISKIENAFKNLKIDNGLKLNRLKN